MEKKVPSSILSGLRITNVEGVKLVGNLFYVDSCGKWVFEVTLDIGSRKGGQISEFPQYSNWHVVVDPAYPLGTVEVYPSKVSSIIVTYPHQNLNEDGDKDLPWRTGKLCLDMPIHGLGFVAGNTDPIGNNEDRLKWHLNRTVAWVRAAATNSLVQNGDPFELPYYPIKKWALAVHDESKSSYPFWKKAVPGEWGIVIWDVVTDIEKTVVAVAYFTRNGILLRANNRYDEKRHSMGNANCLQGVWWLWPSPVVLEPWQAPRNWEELRAVGRLMKIDVEESLRGISRTLRGNEAPLLLIGYPIPEKCGEAPSEIHWNALSLPKLKADGKPPDGFRPNEKGWWQRDRLTVFSGQNQLDYMDTENWHPDRMQARGRLSQPLREARIALIGCGALGSVMAELLVRGGVCNLLLIDHDILAAGNLVRHTLTGEDIGKLKANSLAKKLSSVAPFSSIIAHAKHFPIEKTDVENLLEDRDIVIDCTADDEVTLAIALGWWSLEKLFISAFVGYEAKRTFLFSHQGHSFPQQEFRNMVAPLLQEEKALWSKQGETLEGAGCWSPLFPARLDDLLLAASSCIKIIEERVEKQETGTKLITFEQISDQGFLGLIRTEASADNAERSE